MNYILEVLARQERFWSGLFPEPSPAAPQTAEAQYGEEIGAELAGAVPFPLAETAEAAALAAALDRESSRRQSRERGEAEVREADLRRTDGAKAPEEAQAKVGRAAEETAESGELWHLVRQDGERKAADAQVVSLAFERDARRYDGGYVLY